MYRGFSRFCTGSTGPNQWRVGLGAFKVAEADGALVWEADVLEVAFVCC